MIVWRGLIEASYLEDARVGELLRQRGKTLEAIAYLVDLWRSYPNTASIESDFFGLSQLVARTASEAFTNPALRHELAVAGSHAIAIALAVDPHDSDLSWRARPRIRWPMRPASRWSAPTSSWRISSRSTSSRPASPSSIPRARTSTASSTPMPWPISTSGQYDRAVEVAQAIANATYKDAAGADQPSPNKWQAVYILGQIYDARRQPAKALEYYKQVADRFSDAAGAIQAYTRKDLKVPEVSIVRPRDAPGRRRSTRRRKARSAASGSSTWSARPQLGRRAAVEARASASISATSPRSTSRSTRST